MNSSEKAIVKDMQLASLEVLRKTAHDVFEEKISKSELGSNIIGNTNQDGDDQRGGFSRRTNCSDYGIDVIGLLKID